MTTPTDLPELGDLDADFDDLAVATLQRYMIDEIGVELEALAAETLLEMLRRHILSSISAELSTIDPTLYERRRDALSMAAQRFSGLPPALDPAEDISLGQATIYEQLLAEAAAADAAEIELVDGNTEHDVDQAEASE